MRKNKKYITRIVEQVLDQIAEIYLYFLAIYLVCFIFSLFSERWKLFFDWEIFHFCVVLFGVLSLLSDKGRQWILSQRKLVEFKKVPIFEAKRGNKVLPSEARQVLIKRKGVPIKVILKTLQDSASLSKAPMKRMLKGLKAFAIFTMVLSEEILKTFLLFVRVFAVFMKEIVKSLVVFAKLKIKMLAERLSKEDYIKIGITIITLTYTSYRYKEIEVVNFLVLAYALISILWIIKSRITAGIALLFLASCPLLLILKKEPLAETMAIYAYYFLVICVATQMKEYWGEKKVYPVK